MFWTIVAAILFVFIGIPILIVFFNWLFGWFEGLRWLWKNLPKDLTNFIGFTLLAPILLFFIHLGNYNHILTLLSYWIIPGLWLLMLIDLISRTKETK